MSAETIQWLNDNTLVGFVKDREKWQAQPYAVSGIGDDGNYEMRPWFATPEYTGGFDGPVPIDAIMSRLFCWEAIEAPLLAEVPCDVSEADSINAEGEASRKILVPDYKVIMRDDSYQSMGVFKQGYQIHQFDEWLLSQVATMIDDDVVVDSASLLQGGAVAVVSISLPESVVGKAGFAIRSRIMAFTSHNGKFATNYMRSINAHVCDNSFIDEKNNADKDLMLKFKHSAKSAGRVTDARQALGILFEQSEEDVAFFDALAEWEVTDKQFKAIIDLLEPVPEPITGEKGKITNQRAITNVDQRRGEITTMYVRDERANPWKGTALGVVQAFNTYDQQQRDVRGDTQRVEKQILSTLDGSVGKYDAKIMSAIEAVCDRQLEVV